MRMQRIRARYGVPAKRGMSIRFQGDPVTITGTSTTGMYLMVRAAGARRSVPIHPTWEVEYPGGAA